MANKKSKDEAQEPQLKDNQTKLPSGKIAEVKEIKAKDVLNMRRILGDSDRHEDELIYAVMSMSILIDGKPIIFEDMPEMDGFDFLALMSLVQSKGGGFMSLASK